jgi:hypothetical protein
MDAVAAVACEPPRPELIMMHRGGVATASSFRRRNFTGSGSIAGIAVRHQGDAKTAGIRQCVVDQGEFKMVSTEHGRDTSAVFWQPE